MFRKVTFKRTCAVSLSLALALSMACGVSAGVSADAASKKVKLAKSSISITAGKTKKVKIKNAKKKYIKSIKVKSKKKAIATAKKSGKTAIKVTGKKAGSTKVITTLKLKKKIAGKKKYKLTLKVTIKSAQAATEAPVPTSAPATGPAVEPTAAPTATPSAVTGTAVLTQVKQTKADTVELYFDRDVKSGTDKVTADIISIGLLNKDNQVIDTNRVNSIEYTTDGKVVTAKASKAFTDGGLYRFSCFGISIEETMYAGPVTSLSITTASAEKGEPTKIEYMLLDARGIDVTSAHRLDSECDLYKEGDGELNAERASVATITFDTVGQRATVTVTYTRSESETADTTANSGATATTAPTGASATPTATAAPNTVEGKGTIICVDAKAKIGKPRYRSYDEAEDKENKYTALKYYVNEPDKSKTEEGCVKFYTGTDPVSITCTENGNSVTFYFCAEDNDSMGIHYDSYEAVSADPRYVKVENIYEGGRYARVTVSGYQANKTVNINMLCTHNNVQAAYVVPVTVMAHPLIRTLAFEQTNASLTNTYDSDYYGTLKPKVIDGNGNTMDPKDYQIEYAIISGPSGYELDQEDISVDRETGVCTFRAWGFLPGSYTIIARATVYEDGAYRSAQKSFYVQDVLGTEAREYIDKHQSYVEMTGISYVLDTTTSEIDIGNILSGATGNTKSIKMIATKGGKFLGYVRMNVDSNQKKEWRIGGADGVGYIYGEGDTRLTSVTTGVDFAGKHIKSPDTGLKTEARYSLYGASENGSGKALTPVESSQASLQLAYSSEVDGDFATYPTVVQGNDDYDKYAAKAGTAKVTFTYKTKGMEESKSTGRKLTSTLNVKRNITYPVVHVTTNKIPDLSETSVLDVIQTDVDMNSNTTLHASVKDAWTNRYALVKNTQAGTTGSGSHWEAVATTPSDTSAVVNYVLVSDGGYNYAVKIETTFTLS